MDEVLCAVLWQLLKDGDTTSPRDINTQEILGFTFRLTNPRARKIYIAARQWKESLAVGELAWHMAASDKLSFVSYYASRWADFSADGERIPGSCYGRKIFRHAGGMPSQWERVKAILTEDSASRRAVITLNDQPGLNAREKDVACVNTIQFLIRNNRLHCITSMRSNDAIWGLCYDVFVITMLQERLALELGVDLGCYHHFCGSIHFYEEFRRMVEDILDEGCSNSTQAMISMEDVQAIPDFLAVEKDFRTGNPNALEGYHRLPSYWQTLATPLLIVYERRWGCEQQHKHSNSIPA